MKDLMISVIMTISERHQFLKQAIDSIINQTYSDFELVILIEKADNYVTEIINSYTEKRIHVINNEHGGAYDHKVALLKNGGLRKCTSQFIALMESTDIAVSTRLEKQFQFLQANPYIDVVGGNYQYINENGDLSPTIRQGLYNPEYVRANYLFNNVLVSSTLMFRKSMIEKYDIWYQNEYPGMEDFLFWLRYSKLVNISAVTDLILLKREKKEKPGRMNPDILTEKGKMHALLQEYSLNQSGFHLSEKEISILTKVINEDDSGMIASEEELRQFYSALSQLSGQARAMRCSYREEVRLVCKKLLVAKLQDMDILFRGELRFEEQESFEHKLAIAAIIKNEGAYINEWIQYHLFVGVSKFYLFDNNSNDETMEILSPYIEAGIVELNFLPGNCKQMPAYNLAISKYKYECKYMAFIDGDEFIMPLKREQKIIDIIEEILAADEHAAGLAVNWRIYGSSGYLEKPKGGVIENYLYRAKEDGDGNSSIKTIANPRKLSVYEHPHYPRYRSEYYAIDENGQKVDGYYNPLETIKKIRINHYFTKSKAEWIKRRSMGRATAVNKVRTMDEFYRRDNNDVYDDSMLYFYNQIKDKL